MAKPLVTISGDKELIEHLKRSNKRIQKRVVNNAVKAGGKPIIKDAKSRAPIRTGTLAKSLGSKAKSYDNGETRVVIIGPRASIVSGYQGKVIRPVNYAHIIESGHNNVKANRFIDGTEFIEKAYDAKKNEVSTAIQKKLVAGIEKEMSKGNIRG